MSLSAIVITKNAVETIGRCLTSLQFADEIVVVDSGSTDGTSTVAQELGGRVIHNPWQGYGHQKNVGISAATSEWVLFVDADEEVPPELAAEIRRLTQPDVAAVDFYWLRIVTVFLGHPLFHLYGHNPRLFKKSAGRWTEDYVHEQVQRNEDNTRIRLGDRYSQVITAPLMHYSHRTISSYKHRMEHYTTLDAQQMKVTGHHRSGKPVSPNAFLPWRLAAKQFIKMYVYKKGVLDG